jgi:membrane-associated phospholipid phosphatase
MTIGTVAARAGDACLMTFRGPPVRARRIVEPAVRHHPNNGDGGKIPGYREPMLPAGRRRDWPDGRRRALSPPWALRVGVAASLVVALVAAVVWRTRRPNPADAEMMRWQEVARVRGDGVAAALTEAVGPLAVLVAVVGVALAWRARRWDAVLLALVAAPGTLAVELVLKQVVHRQRPDGGEALLYPSGHVAVATAAALTVVLVLRSTAVAARTRMWVALGAGLSVIVVAVARLVQTVHYATDVVGGVALGLATTCWAALALTAAARREV